ncbi:TasA family protein [Leifsonia sp. YIM 134122]|uniref:TasA family protein n=1 Tax=Leifsonia stereocauli TaxID=3134136 RepID=A0ABU9W568_9MICO
MRSSQSQPKAGRQLRRERGSSSLQGRLTVITGAIVALCAAAILTSGGTFALWNSTASVSAGTITSGTLAITVNDGSTSPISFSQMPLAPGTMGIAAIKVTNSGTIPLDLHVLSTTVSSTTNALAPQLRLGVAAVASSAACTGAAVADPTVALASFSTPASPGLSTLAAGVSTYLCFELKLDSAAPQSVQGGTATFTITLEGNQRTS